MRAKYPTTKGSPDVSLESAVAGAAYPSILMPSGTTEILAGGMSRYLDMNDAQ
jgi:hypothetical protein